MNAPEETPSSVELVMEQIGELTPTEGMEIALRCLHILRNIHSDTGIHFMEEGEHQKAFCWVKDGAIIHSAMELLKGVDME